MTGIGEIAGAAVSTIDLVRDILSRSDRDAIDKDTHELTIKLQNHFAANDLDSDDFRLFVDQLFNAAGVPLTPTRDPDVGRREFIHNALLLAIRTIGERKYAGRAFAALTERKT